MASMLRWKVWKNIGEWSMTVITGLGGFTPIGVRPRWSITFIAFVQKWFDADETETQNQLYLKSAEDYAAKQDAETWDYKNLRRDVGCAVDELVRAVEPEEIEIEVAVEKPRETALAKDVQPVEAQNNSDIPF